MKLTSGPILSVFLRATLTLGQPDYGTPPPPITSPSTTSFLVVTTFTATITVTTVSILTMYGSCGITGVTKSETSELETAILTSESVDTYPASQSAAPSEGPIDKNSEHASHSAEKIHLSHVAPTTHTHERDNKTTHSSHIASISRTHNYSTKTMAVRLSDHTPEPLSTSAASGVSLTSTSFAESTYSRTFSTLSSTPCSIPVSLQPTTYRTRTSFNTGNGPAAVPSGGTASLQSILPSTTTILLPTAPLDSCSSFLSGVSSVGGIWSISVPPTTSEVATHLPQASLSTSRTYVTPSSGNPDTFSLTLRPTSATSLSSYSTLSSTSLSLGSSLLSSTSSTLSILSASSQFSSNTLTTHLALTSSSTSSVLGVRSSSTPDAPVPSSKPTTTALLSLPSSLIGLLDPSSVSLTTSTQPNSVRSTSADITTQLNKTDSGTRTIYLTRSSTALGAFSLAISSESKSSTTSSPVSSTSSTTALGSSLRHSHTTSSPSNPTAQTVSTNTAFSQQVTRSEANRGKPTTKKSFSYNAISFSSPLSSISSQPIKGPPPDTTSTEENNQPGTPAYAPPPPLAYTPPAHTPPRIYAPPAASYPPLVYASPFPAADTLPLLYAPPDITLPPVYALPPTPTAYTLPPFFTPPPLSLPTVYTDSPPTYGNHARSESNSNTVKGKREVIVAAIMAVSVAAIVAGLVF